MKFKLFLYDLWYLPLLFLTSVAMLTLTAILHLLEPVIKVRIRILAAERIGALAHLADLYLRRCATYKRDKRQLGWIVSSKPANRQLMTMIRRSVCIVESPLIIKLYRSIRIMKNSKIWSVLPAGKNSFKDFNQAPPQLSFIQEEHKRASEELLRMGVERGSKFVCFHSRDKAYLDKAHSYRSHKYWPYHDYRDSDIRNYLVAAEYLASLGIYAIRMGYIVESRIKPSNHKIIDYASIYRSDFMDIYLSGNCKFFLGCNAGLHCVAQAFSVPVAAANWIPIKETLLSKRDIFIPMKLWDIERTCFITFREIISSGIQDFWRTDEYVSAGIEVIENTPDEVLALAKEMNARIDNVWISTQEDEELQQRYRDLFAPEHFSYGFQSRIGAEFLRQNEELLG